MEAPLDFTEAVGLNAWIDESLRLHESIAGRENLISVDLLVTTKLNELRVTVVPAGEEPPAVQRFHAEDFIQLESVLSALQSRLPILHHSLQRALLATSASDSVRRQVAANNLNWHLPRLRLWLHSVPEAASDPELQRLGAKNHHGVPPEVEVHNRRVIELIAGDKALFPMNCPTRPKPKGVCKLAARDYFRRLLGIQGGSPRSEDSLESLSKASYFKVRRDYRDLCRKLLQLRSTTNGPVRNAPPRADSRPRFQDSDGLAPPFTNRFSAAPLPTPAINQFERTELLQVVPAI